MDGNLRRLRPAPTQAAFDQLALPAVGEARLMVESCIRLAKIAHPNSFYASKGARFTPSSGRFPCMYIAQSALTAVAEVWGDRLYAQRDLGAKVYTIPSEEASAYGFVSVDRFPPVRLFDLTNPDNLLRAGLDLGTIYSPDVMLVQNWAERIACHPAQFDGMLYRSRHTLEHCAVLWPRPTAPNLFQDLLTLSAGPFEESVAAYVLASKIGIRLSFAH